MKVLEWMQDKKATVALSFLLGLSVALRLAGIMRPLLGNFSGYQTFNAMVAQSYLDHHFSNFLTPSVHMLVAGKQGLVLLCLPISSLCAAFLQQLFGGGLDLWGRFQAVVFFAFAVLFLYRLVHFLLKDEKLAFFSVFCFSLSPLSIIYGQSFHNEMATVFFSLLFFDQFSRWLSFGGVFRGISLSAAFVLILLTRPNALYLLLPICFLTWKFSEKTLKGLGRSFFRVFWVLLPTFAVSFAFYRYLWIVTNTETNVFSSLFSQLMVRSSFVSSLALKPSYYSDLFDVLAGVTLTPMGFFLLIVGIFIALRKFSSHGFFFLWALSFLLSSLLIPRKLLDHNFYLLHFLVPASPLMGAAIAKIVPAEIRSYQKAAILFFVLVTGIVSLRYSFFPAFVAPEEERVIPELGKKIQEFIPKEARIVVQGTHSLLYYSDRLGWALSVARSGHEISDYMKYMNWEKLSREQWEKRNKAFETPETALDYLRSEESAGYFIATNMPEIYANPEFLVHLQSRYRLISEEKGKYQIYQL